MTASQLDRISKWPKWLTISILDMLTELLIFLLSIHLVYSLQIRLYLKLLVLLAFSARLPVIAIGTVRLYYLHQRLSNFTHTFEYIVATQWQMGYSIMSSTITGMGPFLKPFEKPDYSSYYYNDNNANNGNGKNQHSAIHNSRNTARQTTDSRSSESQSYLMQELPSRRQSRSKSRHHHEREISHTSSSSAEILPNTAETPHSQPPMVTLTADEHFCPADVHGRHETEIWAGARGRSRSRSRSDGRGGGEEVPRLVIGKKKEFRIEVDRVV
jgi:hypothetical protein